MILDLLKDFTKSPYSTGEQRQFSMNDLNMNNEYFLYIF